MAVDKRADIWAFGVVLFELLTGKPLFTGQSTTDILAAVVRADPDFSALPAGTPASIRRLLRRCLEKDPKKRLPDIGVARLEIDEALAPRADEAIPTIPAIKRQSVVPWLVAAFAVLSLAVVSWYSLRQQPQVRWTGTRLDGPDVAFSPRISPDGQLLAFLVMEDGQTQVAVMKPDTGNWTLLTHDRTRGQIGTLCWSLDGSKLYFDRWPRGIYSVPVLGGDEQLVVEEAAGPQVLPDGSLLVGRLNSNRNSQLHLYWPESGRLQPLNGVLGNLAAPRVTRAGDRIVFVGKPVDKEQEPAHLYSLHLTSGELTRLAPNTSLVMSQPSAIASGIDGQSMLVALDAGDTRHIVSVPLDGSDKLRTLMTVTHSPWFIDTGSDGSIFLDLWDRPSELLRVSPEGGDPEKIGTLPPYPDLPGSYALPLPDGGFLVNSRTGGRDRLLLMYPGKESVPFAQTQEETSMPSSIVGQTHVAFLIGPKNGQTIAIASLADRRITKRLEGSKGSAIDSMVASPDGKTIYYTADGSVWSISATDGQPQKIRKGDSVAFDPYRQDLIVGVNESEGARLERQPLVGGAEGEILIQGNMRVGSADYLYSNAVGKDGRILVPMVSPASWFWPVGMIDPKTGSVQVIRLGYHADMFGGWSSDGKVIVVAKILRANLWRFRPEAN
jgi:Tol biopolymer transport system component